MGPTASDGEAESTALAVEASGPGLPWLVVPESTARAEDSSPLQPTTNVPTPIATKHMLREIVDMI